MGKRIIKMGPGLADKRISTWARCPWHCVGGGGRAREQYIGLWVVKNALRFGVKRPGPGERKNCLICSLVASEQRERKQMREDR